MTIDTIFIHPGKVSHDKSASTQLSLLRIGCQGQHFELRGMHSLVLVVAVPAPGVPRLQLGVHLVHLRGLVRLPELDGGDARRLQDATAASGPDGKATPTTQTYGLRLWPWGKQKGNATLHAQTCIHCICCVASTANPSTTADSSAGPAWLSGSAYISITSRLMVGSITTHAPPRSSALGAATQQLTRRGGDGQTVETDRWGENMVGRRVAGAAAFGG